MTTKLSVTFSGTGQSGATSLDTGPFFVSISGAGTVVLEYSPDGTNWFAASTASTGTPNSFVVTASTPVGVVGYNVAAELRYRFNATAFTSTISASILQGGQVTP